MVRILKSSLLIFCLLLTGCSRQVREPDELEMIRVIGVDAAEDGCTVTVCTGPPADGGKPTVRSGDGRTIDGALKNLQSVSPNRIPFFSHTEYVIIGEEQAESGIGETLDYIARSGEMRIGSGVVIAKGRAGELIESAAGEDSSAWSHLKAIQEKSPDVGTGCVFTALDAASALLDRSCALLMAVELTDDDNIVPSGFAVIDGGRLTGYLPDGDTVGALILTRRAKSLSLSVTVGGSPAALDLSCIHGEFDPIYWNGEITAFDIAVRADAYLSEIGGKFDPTDAEQRKMLERAAGGALAESIGGAMRDGRRFGADCFGIGVIDSDLPVNITVTVTLTGSYDMDRGLFGD